MVRWRGGRVAVMAVGVGASVVLAACGNPPTTVGSNGSVAPGSLPAAVDVNDPGVVPLCKDVPLLGPIRDGNQPGPVNPPFELIDTMQGYGAQHPDTFAGFWIDRDHGGTAVLAFTDDPAPHRAEVEARRPSPDDKHSVETAVVPGASPVPTSAPPATTVGENGWSFDVVQAQFTESELRALQNDVVGDLGVPGVSWSSSGTDITRNRVSITITPADETVRHQLAAKVPADKVCVNAIPTAEDQWPAGVPKPMTLIPAEGSDPWVTCGAAMPFPASNIDHHPALDSSDPLAVAFRESAKAGAAGGMPTADPSTYYLLARSDTRALFATGSPPTGLVTLENHNGRWVWSGSGGSCQPARALGPPDIGVVTWSLDSAFPAPQPGDTVVHLVAGEQACRSGQPMGDRLLPPEVAVRGDQVLIGLGARVPPGPGSFNCMGTSPEPVTVTLPEPLGTRTIVDGTLVPPQPATSAGAGGAIN